MKNILLLATALAALTFQVKAQIIIDQIVWTSPAGPGVPARAGVISPGSLATDYLDGDAVCNTNYPFPPPMFNTYVYGGVEVSNNVPVCGSESYYIIGSAFSTRADGNYTGLDWQGAAWYPNVPDSPPNIPNTVEWKAACYQEGTDINGTPDGQLGGQYIVSHNAGICWPVP